MQYVGGNIHNNAWKQGPFTQLSQSVARQKGKSRWVLQIEDQSDFVSNNTFIQTHQQANNIILHHPNINLQHTDFETKTYASLHLTKAVHSLNHTTV